MQADIRQYGVGVRNDFNGVVARLADVATIAGMAELTAQSRFGSLLTHGTLDALFVAFSIACALALMPAFGVYQSWRGRSTLQLAQRVLFSWLCVQVCCGLLIFSLHYANDVSRQWLEYWTAAGGAALIGTRMVAYAILSRLRHAGLNQRLVALVGESVHCRSVLRKIDAVPGSGFRPAA